MVKLGKFEIPGLKDPEAATDVAEEIAEPVDGFDTEEEETEIEEAAEEVVEPTADNPEETPPSDDAPAEPEVGPAKEDGPEGQKAVEPDVDAILKENLGVGVAELQKMVAELESLRKSVPDEELSLGDEDDFLKDFIKAYKRGGPDVARKYLEANSIDFGKMSSEDIVKYDIAAKNPGAPEVVLKREYQKVLREMGWSEDMTDEEQSEFEQHFKYRSGQLAERLASEAKKFQIPEREAKVAKEPEQEDHSKEIEEFKRKVDEAQETRALMSSKKISINGFEYAVDPAKVVEMSKDNSLLFANFVKPDGTLDLEKFYKVAAMSVDPDKVVKSIVDDALAKAKKQWIAEKKNTSDGAQKKPAPPSGFSVRLMR